jgi:hypothetical protein
MGVPGVNVAFVPFGLKNGYNGAKFTDDAKGALFGPGIAQTLVALGTDLDTINDLAGIVGLPHTVENQLVKGTGDYLRLDLNSSAGFPNGRKLTDDVIDTVLGLVAGGPLGDNVNANDEDFTLTFPFLAPPHQPRASGVDDSTRN